jgi:hypothetical protein
LIIEDVELSKTMRYLTASSQQLRLDGDVEEAAKLIVDSIDGTASAAG